MKKYLFEVWQALWFHISIFFPIKVKQKFPLGLYIYICAKRHLEWYETNINDGFRGCKTGELLQDGWKWTGDSFYFSFSSFLYYLSVLIFILHENLSTGVIWAESSWPTFYSYLSTICHIFTSNRSYLGWILSKRKHM